MAHPAAYWRTSAVVLLGCFVCQVGLGCGYVFGAVLKHIVAEFEWSRTAFSVASAPVLVAMGLGAALAGQLVERVGARTVLSVSTLLLGLSLWLFSRMDSLWQFYLNSTLFGLAMAGLGDVVVGAVASRWIEGRRGLALAMVFVGSNVGGAVVPVGADAIAAAWSWRAALATTAVGAVVLVLPFALFAIREPTGAPAVGPSTRRGLPADGHEGDLDLRAAMRTRSFWILAALLFSFYLYYLAVTQHLIAFLSDAGFSNARAAASLSVAVALGIVSKIAAGALADRFSPVRLLIANFTVLTAASVALLLVDAPGVLPAFLVAHGLATAAENVVFPLVVIDCFGVTHMARIFGALSVALFPGGVLGPIVAGGSLDWLGDYRFAFAAFALLNAASLVSLAGLRRERGR